MWNKVYRRSFWDEFGLDSRHPLRGLPGHTDAHIDAVTVDSLAAPSTSGLERESGGSITQLKYEYWNLYDRVVSAEIVLDMIDELGRRSCVARCRSLLAEIDLHGADHRRSARCPRRKSSSSSRLTHELIDRLDASALDGASRFDRLQYAALRAGDVELLRRLAVFRDGQRRRGARGTPVRDGGGSSTTRACARPPYRRSCTSRRSRT